MIEGLESKRFGKSQTFVKSANSPHGGTAAMWRIAFRRCFSFLTPVKREKRGEEGQTASRRLQTFEMKSCEPTAPFKAHPEVSQFR